MDYEEFESLFCPEDIEELEDTYWEVIEEEALTQPVAHHVSRHLYNYEEDYPELDDE